MEFHKEITNKNSLFINLQSFLESNRENVFLNVPITFNIEINLNKPNIQLLHSLHTFTTLHKVLSNNKEKIIEIIKNPEKLIEASTKVIPNHKINKSEKKTNQKMEKLIPMGFDKKGVPQYVKFLMPLSHYEGFNLWLLKPTTYNRGRGIHVFSDLNKLLELLNQYIPAKKEKVNHSPNMKMDNK